MLMLLTLSPVNRACRIIVISVPKWLSNIHSMVAPFIIANSYGLFAVMTTKRVELIFEGSNDGENWRQYEFKYKPGDINRRPPFILGHMPRLDWRLWFMPFHSFPYIPSWFLQFLEKMIQHKEDIIGLLAKPLPFPEDQPPHFLRVMSYHYKFSSPEIKKQTGQWWTRHLVGPYIPFPLVNYQYQQELEQRERRQQDQREQHEQPLEFQERREL